MSASGGSVNTKASATGTKDINDLNESLRRLHETIQTLNQASRPFNALGTVSSPISSLSQAKTQYEDLSSEIDTQRRLLGQYQVTYDKFTRSLFDNARQVGRSVQDYAAMRQELLALGAQADTATKQISGLARYSGMSFAQTTQTFQALSVQGAAFSPGNGVGFDANQQSRFMAMLGDAVEKGAAGGLRISMPELLSSVTGLQTQMANLGVRANATGNLGILTAFNASGGLGVSGERGAGVLSSMNQAVAPGGSFNPMMQLYLAQQNPGASYFQLQYQAEQGITSPQMFKDLVAMERGRFGPNADPYMLASAMAQDFGLPSAHVAMDMMNSMDKMGVLNTNDPKYAKLAKYMGQGTGDYTDILMKVASGEFRDASGNFDKRKAVEAYEAATGRKLAFTKVGGSIDSMTEENYMDLLGNEGAPEAGTNYARANEDITNKITNDYISAADRLKESTQTIKGASEKFAGGVENFGTIVDRIGLGGVVGGLGTTGNVVSGALSTFDTLMSIAGMGKILFGGAAPAVAGTTAATTAAATTAASAAVPAAAVTTASAAIPAATAAGGAGILGTLGLIAGGSAVIGGVSGLLGGMGGLLYDQIDRSHGQGRNRYALPGILAAMSAMPGATPFVLPAITGIANARNTRAGARVSNWLSDHIPGFGGIFGRANASTGDQEESTGQGVTEGPKTPTENDALVAMVVEQRKTNDLLGEILSKINLDTAPMTDQNFQRRYGISMPAPNSAAGIGSGATAGATAAGVYGVPGGGTSVGGGGLDTIFGGSNHPISQGFGVQDPTVDQSIYDKYGKEFGMPVDPKTGHVGHTGVDIGVARGTKVYSPVNGKVIKAGGTGFFRDDPSGNAEATGELNIQMKNEDQVILGHLSVIYVKVGQEVSVGQLVALSGTSDMDHVHIEYRKKNTPGMPNTNTGYTIVDPLAALGALSPSAGGGGPSTGMETNVARWAGQTQQTFGDIMDPDIMSAIMTNESHGDPSAYNASGDAYGLFQQVGLKSFDPNVQFQAARKLAQEKLSAINTAYKKNGLDPDARQRAVDFALAWAGHFNYDTGRLNPDSRDKGSGQTAAQLAAIFLRNYDAIKAGRATGGGGNQSRQAMTAYAMATGDTDLYGDASSYGDATGGMSIGFEPLTVNVVFPDGSGYQTKLALTSKDPYTNLRQVGTRNRA